MEYNSKDNHIDSARQLDSDDKLSSLRSEFHFPKGLYFCGHSLGLMPKVAEKAIQTELESWKKYGVEGHFNGPYPWLPYHENITTSFAKLVGAKESEVVAMNTLTVNLHLMLASFYRPTKTRYKILIENNTFPSDKYAVDSQAQLHGYPKDAVVELRPSPGKKTVEPQDLLAQINELGDSLALVMLGNCNYLSGQHFNIADITKAAHGVGAKCGFNLAHGAGNLLLNLHQDGPDFAVWCSYKYLNSGPGGIAGAFVHERHHQDKELIRLAGWWGNNKENRFEMKKDFDPIPTAEAWQLSNPPIFQLAALRASMSLFDKVGMQALRSRGDKLTSYLEFILKENLGDDLRVITPEKQRGSMLCVEVVKGDPKAMMKKFEELNVIMDFREPDILRMCPSPMYNNFEDCFELGKLIKESL